MDIDTHVQEDVIKKQMKDMDFIVNFVIKIYCSIQF